MSLPVSQLGSRALSVPAGLLGSGVGAKGAEGQACLQVTASSSCLTFPYDGLRPGVLWQRSPLLPKLPWSECLITAREAKVEQCPLVIRPGLSLHQLLSWFMLQFCQHHVEKVPFTVRLAKMLKSRFPQSQEAHSALKAGDFAACLSGAPLFRVTSTGSLPPGEDVR